MTTQQQIAEHLGLSQQAVSKQLSKLGIDWKTASLDQIRLEYIKQLRKAAAGQTDEYMKVKLARERIETERVLIQLKKEKGELVDSPQPFRAVTWPRQLRGLPESTKHLMIRKFLKSSLRSPPRSRGLTAFF